MIAILEGSAFNGTAIDPTVANSLIKQAMQLLQAVH